MQTAIFTIAGKEYGVGIDQIKEVIRLKKIVAVPDSAAFVEGVINLRGKVVTVINLRLKLGLEKKPLDRTMRIIVTEIDHRTVGMIVDSVTEVCDINKESLTSPDEVLKDAKYLIGIAKMNNRIILLSDITRLLSGEDKAGIDNVYTRVELRKKGQS